MHFSEVQAHPCSFGDVVCAWVRLPLCLCCSLTPCMRARIATVLGCLHVVLCLCVCERKRALSFVRWCSRLVCKSWPKSFVLSVVCSVYPLISLCLTCACLCHPCSYNYCDLCVQQNCTCKPTTKEPNASKNPNDGVYLGHSGATGCQCRGGCARWISFPGRK